MTRKIENKNAKKENKTTKPLKNDYSLLCKTLTEEIGLHNGFTKSCMVKQKDNGHFCLLTDKDFYDVLNIIKKADLTPYIVKCIVAYFTTTESIQRKSAKETQHSFEWSCYREIIDALEYKGFLKTAKGTKIEINTDYISLSVDALKSSKMPITLKTASVIAKKVGYDYSDLKELKRYWSIVLKTAYPTKA